MVRDSHPHLAGAPARSHLDNQHQCVRGARPRGDERPQHEITRVTTSGPALDWSRDREAGGCKPLRATWCCAPRRAGRRCARQRLQCVASASAALTGAAASDGPPASSHALVAALRASRWTC
eukprot:scaffold659_cov329-Prasinococcus_capsulatus_cf.AAC.22